MTVTELKKIARKNNIVGYSKMRKAELEKAIADLANEILTDVLYERRTTPADGQGLISVIYAAYLACGLKIISENELDVLEKEMSKVTTIEEMLRNRRLMKIINRIPKAFQVRHKHTGIKGMFIVFPLELVDETKDIDIIVTKGLSKYGNGSWGSTDIEVCAYLKRKSEWVALNVQFINALTNYTDPTFLTEIVDYWHNMAMETLSNDIAKLKFHNIVSSFGDDVEDNDLRLATALKTNINLKNEKYMTLLANDQYRKFYEELMTGRMRVPGRYTYMVTDPMFMLNQLYGTNLPELKAGEYWCNGRTCNAGLFRSPLIAPFEAQRVQLVSHKFLDAFYKDLVIFNAYDGAWELMSGADFDGDTCACLFDDEPLSHIVVSAIKDKDYVILHEGKSAQEAEFNTETFWADMARYNSTVARADRTGLITNHATKAIEMWHHLKNCMYYARRNNCKGIYMLHPNQCQKDADGNIINSRPHVGIIDNEKYFIMRGLVYMNKNTNFKWTEQYRTGKYTFEEIEDIMKDFMLKVEYLNPIQGDEIDGAKTGYYPELFDAIEIQYQSEQMTARNEIVGKAVSKTAKKNSYISYSPLSIVFKYAEAKYEEFKAAIESKTANKVAMLKNLLTEEELQALKLVVNYEGNNISIIEYLNIRRNAYGNNIYAIRKDDGLNEEAKMRKISALRDGIDLIENGELKHYKGEIEKLLDLAKAWNITSETMAALVYIATNDGDIATRSTAYGWILFDELLSIFARKNDSVTLYRLPAYTEDVEIINGSLILNGKKFAEVDAEDCNFVPVQNINGRYFALVRKNKEQKLVGAANVGALYNTGLITGFKYRNENVESFKQSLMANHNKFDVVDIDGNLTVMINGKDFGRMQSNCAESSNNYELVGHTVKCVPSSKTEVHPQGVKFLMVQVIC